MVSPEVLRRYPIFAGLEANHLNTLAVLTDEVVYETDETVFAVGRPADRLFVLVDGCVELHYIVADEINPELRKEFFISEINPGEFFGISVLFEPHVYEGTVRARCPSRVLRIDGRKLREICELDLKVYAVMLRELGKALLSRLQDTRVQLVAARG
jgi:CRP-like cAMP-binding protein